MNIKKRQKYLEDKISGYYKQDEKKGLCCKGEVKISVPWIFARQKLQPYCPGCFESLYVDDKGGNLTADRLDNSRGHTEDNCQLMCLRCNVAKH